MIALLNEFVPKSVSLFQENIALGSLVVSMFALIDWSFDTFSIKRLFRKNTVGLLTVRRIVSNFVAFVLIGFIMATYYYSVEKDLSFVETMRQMDHFFFNPTGMYFFIVASLISLSLIMIQSVQRNLGWANFTSLIWGKYKKPKEEDRIFLFVDLISSTCMVLTIV